jgi:hypothetical protein
MTIQNLNHMNVIVQDLSKGRFFVETFLGLKRHSSYPTAYVIGPDCPLLILFEFQQARVPALREHPHHRLRGITLAVDSLRDLGKKALYYALPAFVMADDGSEIFAHEASPEQLAGISALCVRDYDQNLWRFVQA